MAKLNDYKILHKNCIEIFKDVNKYIKFIPGSIDKLQDESIARYGFYYFVLQNILGIEDYSQIDSIICDTEYNETLHHQKFDDCGIDAIYIDENEHKICFFNFKYRKNFNADKKQGLNDTLLSIRFFNAIEGSVEGLENKTKELIDEVRTRLIGDEIWNLKLYIVSNDNYPIDIDSRDIKNMANKLEIILKPYCLDDLMQFVSLRPTPINAILKLPTDAVMSYRDDPLSSNISYIIRLNLAELIRITCDNEEYREQYNIEKESLLSDVKLEYSVLFDNVRGFIVSSKYNKGILQTLKEDINNFFLFNNGLTIVADDIVSTKINANTGRKIEIKGFQVLNGGQTLRTIHKFNQDDDANITKALSHAEVLIRLLKIKDESLKGKIGEYTNSQNSIDYLDLKSLSKEQQDLELYLSSFNIKYIRKKGNIGVVDPKNYDYQLSIQRMGQILLAVKKGLPHEVSNKRKDIFGKYYDDLFLGDDLLSPKNVDLIKSFFEILDKYKDTPYKVSDQKVLYVMYMHEIKQNLSTTSLIEKLEKLTADYILELSKSGIVVAPSRVLIMPKFTDYLGIQLKN